MATAETKITGAQVRMARAVLRWSIADLAAKAGIGVSTVQVIEKADGEPDIGDGLDTTRDWRESERAKSLAAISKALHAAGVTILPDDGKHGPGIRARAARKR